jgi:peroxiredoxin
VLVPLALVLLAVRGGDDGDSDGTAPIASESATDVVRPGDAAPTFSLPTLDGGTVDTAAFDGRPYIVTFWGSWCIPCRKEMPLLQEVFDEHDGDVPVIGVTFRDPESESREFAAEYDITFPLAPDDGIRVARAFGVLGGVPQTFFVGADGVVRDRVAGITSRDELDPPLERLFAPS